MEWLFIIAAIPLSIALACFLLVIFESKGARARRLELRSMHGKLNAAMNGRGELTAEDRMKLRGHLKPTSRS
jgi:peptidoglycan/LPS O-acetylase OafA/YrhL